MQKQNDSVRKLVVMAMLTALSIVLVYLIRFPIFASAPFLEYDMADVPILIGTFLFGPLSGLALTAVTCVIQGLTVSAGSGWSALSCICVRPAPSSWSRGISTGTSTPARAH